MGTCHVSLEAERRGGQVFWNVPQCTQIPISAIFLKRQLTETLASPILERGNHLYIYNDMSVVCFKELCDTIERNQEWG
jgi:hypothetical protein